MDIGAVVLRIVHIVSGVLWVGGAGLFFLLTGVILYWRDFGGISTSPFGLALGLGGVAALIAWLGGNLLIPRTLMKPTAIGSRMPASAGPPPPELAAEMHTTQERLRLIGVIGIVLLLLAVTAMASARYLG